MWNVATLEEIDVEIRKLRKELARSAAIGFGLVAAGRIATIGAMMAADRCARRWQQWRLAHARQRTTRLLEQLDDRILLDIGLERPHIRAVAADLTWPARVVAPSVPAIRIATDATVRVAANGTIEETKAAA